MRTLTPGLYTDVDKATYLSDPCPRPSLSSSIAHVLVTRSPAHAWAAHPRGGGRRFSDENEAMVRGTLIDSLLLGGDTEIVGVDVDDWRTKAAREAKEAAVAAGKLAVKQRDLESAQLAAERISAQLARRGVLLDGTNQITAVWDEGGVTCRARLDHWCPDRAVIYDLKTTRDANPATFARSMISYGYDIQHAAYLSAMETLHPDLAGRLHMEFLVAETEPPYGVSVVRPAGNMRSRGAYYWQHAVTEWGKCVSAQAWPDYSADCVEVSAPPWAMAEMEAAMLGGGSPGLPF